MLSNEVMKELEKELLGAENVSSEALRTLVKEEKFKNISREQVEELLRKTGDDEDVSTDSILEATPKKINNLAQLKRALAVGTRFRIVKHYLKPEWTGQERVVQIVQTNGIYSGIAGEPDHKLSNLNYGKGIWLPFEKASNWVFENGQATAINKQDGQKVFTLEMV